MYNFCLRHDIFYIMENKHIKLEKKNRKTDKSNLKKNNYINYILFFHWIRKTVL